MAKFQLSNQWWFWVLITILILILTLTVIKLQLIEVISCSNVIDPQRLPGYCSWIDENLSFLN
jgi:hypothetical protein